MKGIIIRCERFEFEDTARSMLGGDAIDLAGPLRGGCYSDVLLVLICVETGDGEREVRNSRDRILQLNKRNPGAGVILIAPFAHLSSNLERPLRSKLLCDRLVKILEDRGFRSESVTFGTHKKSLIEFLGLPQAVSYFEYTPRRVGKIAVPKDLSGEDREAVRRGAEEKVTCRELCTAKLTL